jgi:acetate CoA/acetoacetate CoA-transferase alpha subunit
VGLQTQSTPSWHRINYERKYGMKEKTVPLSQALDHVKDGMTVMVGGFLGSGTPETLIDEIVRRGIKGLTVIVSDTAMPDRGVGKLIVNKLVRKVITTHIGTNPETGRQMMAEELDVQLVPQGTLAERIRSAGAGLGGFLTPTGLGTEVAEGKQVITVNDTEYLLELPLRADVAFLRGSVVDTQGNIQYFGTTRNMNPLMAMAADTVIVEAQTLVGVGEIKPEDVATPGLFVDYIVRRDA